MKTCNSCAYHYADRSGAVCNALHAIASADQAEQCQDYEQDASKVGASRDRWVVDSPEGGCVDVYRFERVYFDGRSSEPLPFAIGAVRGSFRRILVISDGRWGVCNATSFTLDAHIDTCFASGPQGRYRASMGADSYLLSLDIEIDTFDQASFDGPLKGCVNFGINFGSRGCLSISRLPVKFSIIRVPIAPSPDTAPQRA